MNSFSEEISGNYGRWCESLSKSLQIESTKAMMQSHVCVLLIADHWTYGKYLQYFLKLVKNGTEPVQ